MNERASEQTSEPCSADTHGPLASPVAVQHAYRARMHVCSDSFHALHKPIVCVFLRQEPFSVL